ncbi:MAG: 50S ribosomal protein L1 [Xanthomonadaceae bacterium]|nr:50S ribosomal protein L1 [Rhodospirillaceae bacterium]NIA17946.1 50S ribosomal protein L1 [Xanthomonadaceae bacterium]
MKKGKKYLKMSKSINKNKIYEIEEALDLIKKNPVAKFDASIEIHIRLGINPKKGDQQVRGTIILPYSISKQKKIIVFAEDEKQKEATMAGADIIGSEEMIQKIKQTKKIDFEIVIATPGMMRSLTSIAKILGPKGLMPSPKNGTISTDLTKTIKEFKKGKISFKNDDTGNIHQIIGKISLDNKKIIENYKIFLKALNKAKPATAKGVYIKNIYLCSTMGPSIKVKEL